jgi:hypothetical protein
MALYTVAQGGVVNAADIDQLVNLLNGTTTGVQVALAGGLTVAGGFSVTSGVGAVSYAWSTSSTSRASTTTLANDPYLTLPVVANATYIYEAYVAYSNALGAGSADIKATWSAPTGATLVGTMYGTSGANSSSYTTYDVTENGAGTTRSMPGNTSQPMSFQPRGSLTTGSTAGNLVLQWAQNTSSTTPTIVIAGSWMQATRVA